MIWYEALNGSGLLRWLEAVAGTNHVAQGQPLDPFATSMRVSKRIAPWLDTIERQGPELTSGGHDVTQVGADLGRAGLVVREAGKAIPSGSSVLINLSGRGDKDVDTAASYFGLVDGADA